MTINMEGVPNTVIEMLASGYPWLLQIVVEVEPLKF
jgi:hypothetical protein